MIETPPFIKALLKDATEAELAEATENVARYLAAVMRIYERLECRKRAIRLNRRRQVESKAHNPPAYEFIRSIYPRLDRQAG